MNKIIICGHTIFEYPFQDSNILDVGCRNYGFANQMAIRGCKVIGVEPDTSTKEPTYNNIRLIRTAMVSKKNAGIDRNLVKWSTGEGNFLEVPYRGKPKTSTLQKTSCSSILQIMKQTDISYWDVIKLDCEGAEYEILLDWPGPIAGQITVEFHEFSGANQNGAVTYHEILSHLSEWYDIVQHEWTARYGQKTENYWDSLFVLKGGFDGQF